MSSVPTPIVIEATFPVRANRAWQAITDPAEVAEWFADVSPVGVEGSPYEIDFGDGSRIEGVVRVLEPGRRLAYTWTWAGEPGTPTTLVTWEVADHGETSTVRLTHDGWAEAGADVATRDDHAGYWQDFLAALEDWLEDEPPAMS